MDTYPYAAYNPAEEHRAKSKGNKVINTLSVDVSFKFMFLFLLTQHHSCEASVKSFVPPVLIPYYCKIIKRFCSPVRKQENLHDMEEFLRVNVLS